MVHLALGAAEATGPDESLVRAALVAASGAFERLGLAGPVSLALLPDAEVRALNARFRGLDLETDVLTFPSGEGRGEGDIAISLGVAQAQALVRGQSPANEVAILAIHGALHLAGMDDADDAGRIAMQRETARLAREMGLPCEAEWVSSHYLGEHIGEHLREEVLA